MNKLIQFCGDLRSSFWFMPSLMVAGSIAFAVVLIETDSAAATDDCIESSHDRARLERRLSEVREMLETQSALCAGEVKG